MKEFRVGDRVRAYGNSQTGLSDFKNQIGTVEAQCSTVTGETCWYNVKFSKNKGSVTYHEKQLRRLKKKAKPPEYYSGKTLEDGTIYVGVLFDEKRKQFYRLSMDPADEPNPMTWDDAMKTYGDRLPTAKEQSAMRGCLPVGKLPAGTSYYWSSTENSSISVAWIEQFFGGYQGTNSKGNTYLVRCVRRFNYSSIQ